MVTEQAFHMLQPYPCAFYTWRLPVFALKVSGGRINSQAGFSLHALISAPASLNIQRFCISGCDICHRCGASSTPWVEAVHVEGSPGACCVARSWICFLGWCARLSNVPSPPKMILISGTCECDFIRQRFYRGDEVQALEMGRLS